MKMMSTTNLILLLIGILFNQSTYLYANNQTPSELTSVLIAPLVAEGDRGEQTFMDMTGEDYGQMYIQNIYLGNEFFGINPDWFFLHHTNHIDGSEYTGVMLYTGHGGSGYIMMDCFYDSIISVAAQKATERFDAYCNMGFGTNEMLLSTHGSCYVIKMHKQAILNRGNYLSVDEPLVYIGACYSSIVAPEYVNMGARVSIGYSGSIDKPMNRDNVETFFKRLNGEEGQSKRAVSQAISNLPQIITFGATNTTLSPSISFIDYTCPLYINDTIYFYFDTECNLDEVPDIIGTNCIIENEEWLNNTCLIGICTGTYAQGPFAFNITLPFDDVCSENNGAGLDGNTIPWGYNAFGPSNDDYFFSEDCLNMCQGECGDASYDGSVNISDAVYLINYVFTGGDPPMPVMACGDPNNDADVNISDAVYIINFVQVGGTPPGDCKAGYWSGLGGDCCPYDSQY